MFNLEDTKPSFNPYSIQLIGRTPVHENQKILDFQNSSIEFLTDSCSPDQLKILSYADSLAIQEKIGQKLEEALYIMIEQELLIKELQSKKR